MVPSGSYRNMHQLAMTGRMVEFCSTHERELYKLNTMLIVVPTQRDSFGVGTSMIQ